jgi:type IV pilus assembly protein PilA
MRKNSNKGFTLAELLIVVAIIVVLVAISIPIFSTQLEKARESADMANLRDAKAAAVALYLTDNENAGTYYYDAEKGVLVAEETEDVNPVTSGYGKGTAKAGHKDTNLFYMGTSPAYYTKTTVATDKVIKIVITDSAASDAEASIQLDWVAAGE